MSIIPEKCNPSCLRITAGTQIFYGGDQAWFDSTVGQYGGCGTVAAADITAYLAHRHPALHSLYGQGEMNQTCFLNHMNMMREWVKPWTIPFAGTNRPPRQIFGQTFGWTFGVWPMGRLLRGVERFARASGVSLKGLKLHSWCSMERLTGFIQTSLERDCPVAMLIGRKPRYERGMVTRPDGHNWEQTHFAMHWVVVTELAEREGMVMVKALTWGGYTWLNLEEWHKAGGLVPGLVSFVW